MRRSNCGSLMFVLLVYFPFPGSADDGVCEQRFDAALEAGLTHFQALSSLTEPHIGCYGGSLDKTEWVVEAAQNLARIADIANPQEERDTRKSNAIATVTAIRNRLEEAEQLYPPAVWGQLRDALQAAIDQLKLDAPIEGATSPPHWELLGDGRIKAVPSLRLRRTMDSACEQSGQECEAALAYGREIARVSALTERGMNYHSSPVVKAFEGRYTQRRKMWDAYREQALPQYLWEWLANGWLMDFRDKRPRDSDGDPMGPPNIPRDQLILLHPSIGFESVDVENGGDESDATLYLELIGYNRWAWDETTGDIKGGLGLSIIGAVSDRERADDLSLGLMVHIGNKFSVALTDNNGDTGILIGLDLAKLFSKKLNTINENVRELAQPW